MSCQFQIVILSQVWSPFRLVTVGGKVGREDGKRRSAESDRNTRAAAKARKK
jgi:hypothetical protein